MIEVFKTNIVDATEADGLVGKLQNCFPGYKVNFDLDDCDHILRVNSFNTLTDVDGIIKIVSAAGYSAEVLQGDEVFERSITSFETYQHIQNVPSKISKDPG